MNFPIIAKILARVMGLEAVLMVPSMITALWYGESVLWYVETAAIAAVLAVILNSIKPRRHDFYAREGFVSVSLAWVLMSAVGALPFVISGLIPKRKGSSITYNGMDITNMSAETIVSKRLSLVPEGRRIFPDMTVTENLEMGAYLRFKDKSGIQKSLEEVYELFPRLEERKKQVSKTLSGGELQMLAVARALMAKPEMIMLDEPSTGLAPLVVKGIFDIIKNVRDSGTTVLLVEQNAKMALGIADRGYVLKNGQIVMEDTGKNLLNNDDVRKAYLGEKK